METPPIIPTPNLPQTNTAPKLIMVILFLLFILSSGIAGYLYFQNSELKQQALTTYRNPSPSPIISITPTPTPTWKTARFGNVFSYDYPADWHVTELWQDNYAENGIVIAIDPNPINTAPRGGPRATFEITVLNGNKDPDSVLAKKMAVFNPENYSDITKETLTSDLGPIYHYQGKIAGEMLKGEPIEEYFFTFGQNPSDLLNRQVVIATLALKDDPQLQAMLNHIVLSFEKSVNK